MQFYIFLYIVFFNIRSILLIDLPRVWLRQVFNKSKYLKSKFRKEDKTKSKILKICNNRTNANIIY